MMTSNTVPVTPCVWLVLTLSVHTVIGHRCTATNLVADNSDKDLESPSYGSYSNNVKWCRRIIAEDERVIIITLEHVDLEGQAGNCVDYLDIMDGDYSRSKSLGRFCQTNSTTITTTSEKAFLVFRTDPSGTRVGFKLRYRQSEEEDNTIWSSALAGIAGGLAIVWIFMCCCCLCSKKQKVVHREPSAVHPIQNYSTEECGVHRQHGDRVTRPRVWQHSDRDRTSTNIYHIVFRTSRRKQDPKINRTSVEPAKPPVYEEEDPSPAKLPAYEDVVEEEFTRIISPPPIYRELEQEEVTSSVPMSPPPAYPRAPSSTSTGPYL